VRGDRFTPIAFQIAADFKDPIPLIALTELELKTRIHRGLGDGTLTPTQQAAVLTQIEHDVRDGILVRKSIESQAHLEAGLLLSRKYAPSLAVRTLDIMHVAAARILKCRVFVSFDKRQRDLAEAVHMKLLPTHLP